MIRIFPSFSFLINKHISFNSEKRCYERNSYVHQDSPDTFYFFGCCREGIDRTFELYDRHNCCPREQLISAIFTAEKEDRVCWRKVSDSYNDEIRKDLIDRKWLESKLGISIPVREVRNLPTMRDFFANYPNIQYMF